jgi:hypothetical protein
MTPSNNALLACAKWLSYCLAIGWSRSDLDRLEQLWWKYHDDRGNLLMGPIVQTRES